MSIGGSWKIFQKHHYVLSLVLYSSLGNHHHSRQIWGLDLLSNLLQLLLHSVRYKKHYCWPYHFVLLTKHNETEALTLQQKNNNPRSNQNALLCSENCMEISWREDMGEDEWHTIKSYHLICWKKKKKKVQNIWLHRKISVVEARERICSASAVPQRWWTIQGKSSMASVALDSTKCQKAIKPFVQGISTALGGWDHPFSLINSALQRGHCRGL